MRTLRSMFLAAVAAMVLVIPVTVAADKPEDKPATQVKLEKKKIPQYLQDISVTVATPRGTGSGVYKVTKDGQVWVWTCGHVVEGLRSERAAVDKKLVVDFADAKIVKFITEGGRNVGETSFDAEVIRYSDAETGHDLALLRLRTTKFKPAASVNFYLEKEIPEISTELYHCGSLLGKFGSNSLTTGIMSQHGRLLFNDKVFDQTTCTAFPGSSGGPVVLKDDGRYVGMLVRGAGEGFNLIVPVRRMHEWAKKQGVEFTLDTDLPIPTDDELRKLPIDDGVSKATAAAGTKHADAKAFPTREAKTATPAFPSVEFFPDLRK
jgi:hypothetical protein